MATKQLPVTIVFVMAVIILLDNFAPSAVLKPVAAQFLTWAVLLTAFALILGMVNMIRIHTRKIQRRAQNWYGSAALIAGIVIFLPIGLAQGSSGPLYQKLFQRILSPFSQSFWGVVLFFICSAAFRGFVAKRWQAGVILVSGLVTMLAQVPIGDILVPGIGALGAWVSNVPNNAGQRGIIIGAAIGSIVQQVRVILGLDRGHFGG
jgi:hypothetical protein